MKPETGWSFYIDVGGTFTDCIGRSPEGAIKVHKLLSTGAYKGRVAPGSDARSIVDPGRGGDPAGFFAGFTLSVGDQVRCIASFDPGDARLVLDRPLPKPPETGAAYELRATEEAPIIGVRWLMGIGLFDDIGPVEIRLGTTRGTNALLEKTGARTLFITTKGFADILLIANQDRPRLFDLDIRKPVPLFEEVLEVDERVDADGRVRRAPDEPGLLKALEGCRALGLTSAAICLLNAHLLGTNEEIVARLAERAGFEQVSVSSKLSPVQKIVSRGDTTVVDAYLSPIIRSYVASLRKAAPRARLRLMTSAGALTDAEAFVGKDAIFSGPAGGVVGLARVAQQAGIEKAVGFDMGGTSTDVSRFDGSFERRYEMRLNDPASGTGVRITAPMLAIETVAAGGGSVCGFDGVKPVVGPRSAGADPGPACYGRGGPLTLTDVNLFLGRLAPDLFPFPLDRKAVERRLREMTERIARETGVSYSQEALAQGFVRIANAGMAAPIKKISVARGIDARDHGLVCFGGAGGQHACAVARSLGMTTVVVPLFDGVLSAFGIAAARAERFSERHVGVSLDEEGLEKARAVLSEMTETASTELSFESDGALSSILRLDVRYSGQDHCLTLALDRGDGPDRVRQRFESHHRKVFGFAFPDRRAEIHAARCEVSAHGAYLTPPPLSPAEESPEPLRANTFHWRGTVHDAPVFHRADLGVGDTVDGPALILADIGTVVVDPGWTARVDGSGNLVLADRGNGDRDETTVTDADPITLEIFNNHFASIAEQMGAALQKTALSVNVKERLDFSCALFDEKGELVVNAPHIPVHLGGLSDCVKMLTQDVPHMAPGDVFVTNDPYRGGSHLPDVTVITPVFDDGVSERPLFFCASRAHHAEIGGIAPGSMPSFSTRLGEEGVVIRHVRLVSSGEPDEDALLAALKSGPHPSRTPEENIADIRAQAAANRLGETLVRELVARHGLEVVQAYMGHIREGAARKMRLALKRFEPGTYSFEDVLDDGSPIRVNIVIRRDGRGAGATVDFTGTGPVLPGNLNANAAITASAVLYTFRLLIDDDIPLNAGVLDPVDMVLPECFLNPRAAPDPSESPAVAGGNVETSQRIVDTLIGALGVAAAGQGTMNNVTFGNDRFGYYETVAGGSGAGPGFQGASGVHVHMTNTRITDPEVLEARYPVRLLRFGIREGSGGDGEFRGGDGVVRDIEFLEPVRLSLLTQRRTRAPWGACGGGAGLPGRNRIARAGGAIEDIPSIGAADLEPGDRLILETPGGGGWGTKKEEG